MAIRRAKQKSQVIALLQQQAPAGEQFLACIHCETGPSPWLGMIFDEIPVLGLVVALNRKLDADYSDGLEIIKTIKADAKLSAIPCMLITNYADHQDAAVAAGAHRGFGKKELAKPETHERLKAVLG